jgi:hypothetical protein
MSISKEFYKNKEKYGEFEESAGEPKRKKKASTIGINPKIKDNKIRMLFD